MYPNRARQLTIRKYQHIRMSKFNYKAFISYCHQDERWAAWLHRALESYHVPRKLVGSKTSLGKVPARIRPVFRDREDLSAAADLSSTVKQTLSQSENLIVVCSPAAAASRWVKEEIREFSRLGRQSHVFCVIVDGEPAEDGSVAACFPDAISESGLEEPLAADVRKWADGKQLAKLKLIAGMLGLPLDQLRRRDLQKRQKKWLAAGVASIAVIAIVITAITARMAAQQRRDSGESLVAYKLMELRNVINLAEDPEDLARLKTWNERELVELIDSAGSEDRALTKAALSLRDQGNQLWESGDFTAAMEKYEHSWALLAESYRRDRSDHAAFFELGQAEFYIGQVHFSRGELDLAEAVFMSYTEITRRLILLQPENAKWVLEMAYALTNLGEVQRVRGSDNPESTLQLMQSALEYNQIALVLDPGNEGYRSELAQSHANLSDAQLNVCDLEGALQSRQENVARERSLFQDDPGNTNSMVLLSWALRGFAYVQEKRGYDEEAMRSLESSLTLVEEVAQRQPNVLEYQRIPIERKQRIAWLEANNGRAAEAWKRSDALSGDWERLQQESSPDDLLTMRFYYLYLIDHAWLARELGELELAERLVEDAIAQVVSGFRKLPDSRELGNLLTLAAYRFWKIKTELPSQEILALLPDYGSDQGRTRACVDASMAVRKSVMLGESARAGELVAYLLDNGYREADFMRVCSEYYYC